MNLLPVLTTDAGWGLGGTILYFAALIGIFWFFFIRPQRKQEQEHAAMLTTVQSGDSVLTSSGFYGVVIDVTDDVVIVEFGNNKHCRIPMKKSAIIQVEKATDEKQLK